MRGGRRTGENCARDGSWAAVDSDEALYFLAVSAEAAGSNVAASSEARRRMRMRTMMRERFEGWMRGGRGVFLEWRRKKEGR
jgi:hypothetical protein